MSILTVEARHAGAIGYVNEHDREDGLPEHGSFDKPLTAATVLAAVAGTKFIVS